VTGTDLQNAVAIVGMAGRFPGARSVRALWRNLRAGEESITFLDDDELRAAGVPEALIADPSYVKAGAFLADPDRFDAAFFGVPPREAELMDPQQRVFLECAWEALEDAGYDVSRTELSIGVFAGMGKNHYYANNLLANPAFVEAMGPVATTIASEKDFAASRISYKLDLEGPSVSVQTACSTSLVAVHLACQSLLLGECDMVLAGGASISSFAPAGYLYSEDGIFSPDGHLRAFDAQAAGQVGGNGAAVVLLKRLAEAVEDGDTIHAVIRGSAVNNDGLRKVSFNAPGVDGQARVVAEALEVAGVEPRSIGYVECHGTGTHLGDPIEVAALTQAFRTGTDAPHATGFCGIGSLKTNVGHLDAAAGAAGLIKAALVMEHGVVPPSLHFERANPELKLDTSPFFVNAELSDWPADARPRRAGVSSFGMGGTNAHAILEEPPAPEAADAAPGPELVVLSARTTTALAAMGERLADHLDAEEGRALDLADVAHTTRVGRKAFTERRAFVAADLSEAAHAAREGLGTAASVSERSLEKGRPVALLFSGQGSQYANMARGLYERFEVFRTELDRTCELLEPHVGRDLRTLFFPEPGGEEAADRELALTQNTQPALFVVEYALARQLAAWGVEPESMLGHSIGEYVAACLAGIFSLEDALRVVAARGRLIGSLPTGSGMLSVPLSEEEATARLVEGTSIAVVNAPELCVVAGELGALEELRKRLRAEKVPARMLHTSHAFHTALMDPILEAFAGELATVQLGAPERPVVSSTTGTWLTAEEACDPQYWVRHLREPVRFADGVATLVGEDEQRLLLEVGPGQALTALARQCAPTAPVVPTTRLPKRDEDDVRVLLEALGRLWCEGVRVDWEGFRDGARRRRVPLPTYPFERERFWIEPAAGAGGVAAASAVREPDPARWFWAPTWRRGIDTGPAALPARALLFSDGSGVAEALATAWRSAGVDVVVADPAEPGDHERALDELGAVPPTIVHLAGIDPARTSAADREAVVERGFHALVRLGRSLAERRLDGEVRLEVVTSGAQDVLDDQVEPEKATVSGACKAIRVELPNVQCRHVDVEPPGDDPEACAARLLDELGHTEPVVALRAGRRWLQDVERVRVEGPPSIPSPHPPGDRRSSRRLRENGVVLVTGGLGGVGLALAEGLVRDHGARLVLLGRSGLPERDAWDAWLGEHGEDDPTSRRIAAVRGLEALGAEVLVARADVAREDEVRSAVAAAQERFGGIHAVVHAAGLPGGTVLPLATRESADAVLAPKVRGTRVLERVFERELAAGELDLFLLCSSLATVLDGVGQADYFAANAFLDAFALAHRDDPGRPVVSVGWEAWREVGMAAEGVVPEALRAAREENLRLGLAADEGREVLGRVLSTTHPLLLVSTRDLRDRIAAEARATAALTGGDEAGPEETRAGSLHARPKLATAFVEPRTETERAIAAMWGELLGIAGVGAEDDFFELGGNSLLLMQVSTRLRGEGVSLSMRELFDTPTVTALSERVESLRLLADQEGSVAGDDDETEELRL
jgi:acyl transferase domain-containing protein/aryl carrier-like protein